MNKSLDDLLDERRNIESKIHKCDPDSELYFMYVEDHNKLALAINEIREDKVNA